MTTPNGYEYGKGELLRAQRLYLSMSKDGMAMLLRMKERSLSRIERGEDAMPPGVPADVDVLLDRFDIEVEEMIADAERRNETVKIRVQPGLENEWQRAIVGRAAVQCPLITPILGGEETGRRAG